VSRTCTVCAHPERAVIDRALVADRDPYRDLAGRYGLTRSAIMRHKADHLLADIVAAWQDERRQHGLDLADELRGWMDHLNKLFAACDRWLTDPDDPTRYDLSPRAHEVMVHYEERQEERGRTTILRRKARLADLLDQVGTDTRTVVLVEHKSADPRKLILDTSKTLESHLRLLGEIVGKLQTPGTTTFLVSPEWTALRTRMLAALAAYPEARYALAEAIEKVG